MKKIGKYAFIGVSGYGFFLFGLFIGTIFESFLYRLIPDKNSIGNLLFVYKLNYVLLLVGTIIGAGVTDYAWRQAGFQNRRLLIIGYTAFWILFLLVFEGHYGK